MPNTAKKTEPRDERGPENLLARGLAKRHPGHDPESHHKSSIFAHDLHEQLFQGKPLRRELVDIGARGNQMTQDVRQDILRPRRQRELFLLEQR